MEPEVKETEMAERMVISVVTATFNSAGTIRETLDSVLGQTYSNIEHLIVDGQSTDNTMDIIREYEPRYEACGKVLRWVSERDRGLYDAMNKGIGMASGDVIGILNSDDFYTSADVLENVVSGIEGVDAVYGDIHYVSPADLTKPVRYYSSKRFRRLQMLMGYMPAHPSFYCRASVYKRYGGFDTSYKIGADFEQLFRLIYVNRLSTKYIPCDFVTMRKGGASTDGFHSHLWILRDHFRAYVAHKVPWAILLDVLRYPQKLFSIYVFRLFKA